MKTKLALIALLFAMSTGISFAQIPSTMSYQGVLTDANGNVVADDTYQLRFRLYGVPSGGTPLWDETQSVLIEKGLFNVILGAIAPLELPFIQEFWLGTTINGGTELTPRTHLTSAAYSFNARMVAGGPNIFPVEGSVGIGIPEPQHPLHVAGVARFNVRPDSHIDMSTPGGWPGFITLTPGDHRRDIVFDDPDPSSGYKGGIRLLVSDTNSGPGAQNGITINEDGDVGIGTNIPAEKLEVAGTIYSSSGGFKFPDGSVQTTAAGGAADGDNLGNHTATENIKLNGHWLSADGGNEGVYVNNSGRVGIKESSPATHLHVHGSPIQSRGQLSISAPPGEDTFISFYEGNNFKSYFWYDDNTDDLNLQNFNESNGGDLNLNPFGGNVGIGTNTPTEKLQVTGTIHSTSGGFKFPDGSVQTTAGGGTGGDNLGNHTATQNVDLNGHTLINGGIAHEQDLNMQSTRNLGISVGNDLNMQSGRKLGIATGDNIAINASTALNMQTGDSLAINAGTDLNIEAINEITIKCGSASIVMKKNGDIFITGGNIRIVGSGSVTIKGKFIQEN
jgi:hypothetical protein